MKKKELRHHKKLTAVFVLDFVVLREVLRCSENALKALGTASSFN